MTELRHPEDLHPNQYSVRVFRQRSPSVRVLADFDREDMPPLVVKPDGEIVDGHYRWLAALELDWSELPVEVREFESVQEEREFILRRDDDELDDDRSFSRKMRVAEEYEKHIAPLVHQRIESGKPLGEYEDPLQDLAEGENVTTRELVAARIGWSGEKLRQAWKVWEAYNNGEGWAQQAVVGLDSGDETVNSAYHRYKTQQEKQRRNDDFDPEDYPLNQQAPPEVLPSPETVFPYPGGKADFARWVIGNMPEHKVYVEVFGGAAAVLLNKPPSVVEVYNDRDPELAHFFEMLRDDVSGLEANAGMIPFEEEAYNRYTEPWHRDGKRPSDPARRAAVFFFNRHAQWGGKYEGANGFAGDEKAGAYRSKRRQLREFHKRLVREDVSYFLDRFWPVFEETEIMPFQLDRAAFTFFVESALSKKVEIHHRNYADVLDKFDGEHTLFYCDPPYGGTEHRYQVGGDFDHKEFAEHLTDLEADWMVSYGADVPDALEDYRRETKEATRQMASGKPSMERLIMNFPEEDSGWFLRPEEYLTWGPEAPWGRNEPL